jgi:hypothetical protein
MMGSSSCLPAWEAFPRSSSLLRFLLSRTDECTGNGGPGSLIEHSGTTGRLGLGLLGLEGEVFSSSALLARDHVEDSSLASGDNGFGPSRLAERSLALVSRTTAATLRSTALARGAGGSKNPVGRQVTDGRALARTRVRLPSVYPLRDRSRSQVFLDEGES